MGKTAICHIVEHYLKHEISSQIVDIYIEQVPRLLLPSHVCSPLGVEEIDRNSKQKDANINSEQNHEGSEVIEGPY
jgi:hypothetical protein